MPRSCSFQQHRYQQYQDIGKNVESALPYHQGSQLTEHLSVHVSKCMYGHFYHYHQLLFNRRFDSFSLTIDREALAKQGDNGIGRVRLFVCLCVLSWLNRGMFDLDFLAAVRAQTHKQTDATKCIISLLRY